MPSVVAMCDSRPQNVLSGRYPKFRIGEDHPTGALWVTPDTDLDDMTFMIGVYAEGVKLKVLRIFAHAMPGEVILGKYGLDWMTADLFGTKLRGKFADKGRIELHCCQAAADMPHVWQGMADAARTEVWASPDMQKGKTILFDGRLLKFRPKLRKRR